MSHYQMCQAQVDKMQSLVVDPARLLLVAQLVESDKDDTRKVIEENLAMIGELVTLGLLEDTTEAHKEVLDKVIKTAQEEDGLTPRGYLVYTATEIGNKMFSAAAGTIN